MRRTKLAILALATFAALLSGLVPAVAVPDPNTEQGAINGANFIIQMPAGTWNQTLVLYSHGYVTPGSPLTATDAGDAVTGQWLLDHGYAIAGSSYRTNGWAIEQALPDQIALLDHFKAEHSALKRTIAWGHSLGGMITAGLIQNYPNRFAAALPMCGVVAGGVGVWNSGLDAEFVIAKLVAHDPHLQLVNITNTGFGPGSNLDLAEQALTAAQATDQGKARIALAAAVADTPGWFSPSSAEPAANDFVTRELNQFKWDSQVTFPFAFALRAEMEARAGGNPSWNTGVDYADLLEHSINRKEVEALYTSAGLSLKADLKTLAGATRVNATESAVDYLAKNIVYNGDIDMPVLTLHTIGDGLVLPQDEQAYASVIRSTGDQSLLRQTFVHRAGHCAFSPGETIAAFQALVHRLDSGHWGSTSAGALNTAASGLGATLNPFGPSFVQYQPSAFPRPFDARNLEEGDSGDQGGDNNQSN